MYTPLNSKFVTKVIKMYCRRKGTDAEPEDVLQVYISLLADDRVEKRYFCGATCVSSGNTCMKEVENDGMSCPIHDSKRKCRRMTQSGSRCRNTTKIGHAYCWRHADKTYARDPEEVRAELEAKQKADEEARQQRVKQATSWLMARHLEGLRRRDEENRRKDEEDARRREGEEEEDRAERRRRKAKQKARQKARQKAAYDDDAGRKPKDAPLEKPKDAPLEKPKDAPLEKPKDAPLEKPKDAPLEKPKDAGGFAARPTSAADEEARQQRVKQATSWLMARHQADLQRALDAGRTKAASCGTELLKSHVVRVGVST